MKRDCRNQAWRGLAFIAAIPFTGSSVVFADPVAQDTDATRLEEIIVRATRMDKPINEIPAAISVISKDEIQRGRQQLGLDESLSGMPGVFISDRYNFSRDLRISIRGFGARSAFGVQGVKILVDGIPETLPDGQSNTDGIDLGSTQRIEVIRGPSSSLYGNASGGVINISHEGPNYKSERAFAHVARIGTTLSEVFRLAEAENIPSSEAADRLAERRLQGKPRDSSVAA